MYLRVDSQHEVMTANKHSNIDLLSQVGGLYTSSIALIYIVSAYFTRKLFFSSLIKKLYSQETVLHDGDRHNLSRE